MNILVVKPSSLGDVVHTFPAVQLLRNQFPDAVISWLINESLSGLLELFPAVDDVIVFRRRRLANWRHWHEIIPFCQELRQLDFDVALDFQGLMRSGLLTFLSGAPRRVGFRAAREGAVMFYTERVPLPANLRHAVGKNRFLVRSAFSIAAPDAIPELTMPPAAVKSAQLLLGGQEKAGTAPILAVAPGARWPTKVFPATFLAAVLDVVVRQCPQTVCCLLGSADEQAAAGAVQKACSTAQPLDLTGRTDLVTLAGVLRQSDVLLTNDSGPMHLAAALGVPCVALFGPTDAELTGPYGDGHAVFSGHCEQRPCFMRRCPLPHTRCTEGVSVEATAAAVITRLCARADARGRSAGAFEGANDVDV